jgi:hypothetical protein
MKLSLIKPGFNWRIFTLIAVIEYNGSLCRIRSRKFVVAHWTHYAATLVTEQIWLCVEEGEQNLQSVAHPNAKNSSHQLRWSSLHCVILFKLRFEEITGNFFAIYEWNHQEYSAADLPTELRNMNTPLWWSVWFVVDMEMHEVTAKPSPSFTTQIKQIVCVLPRV